jgi:hypothetical protein
MVKTTSMVKIKPPHTSISHTRATSSTTASQVSHSAFLLKQCRKQPAKLPPPLATLVTTARLKAQLIRPVGTTQTRIETAPAPQTKSAHTRKDQLRRHNRKELTHRPKTLHRFSLPISTTKSSTIFSFPVACINTTSTVRCSPTSSPAPPHLPAGAPTSGLYSTGLRRHVSGRLSTVGRNYAQSCCARN